MGSLHWTGAMAVPLNRARVVGPGRLLTSHRRRRMPRGRPDDVVALQRRSEVTGAGPEVVPQIDLRALEPQLAENPDLGPVFADLFDSFESELMLKPAGAYVSLDAPARFADVVASARRFQEIAIGYRRHGRGADDGEIVINPAKSREVSFSEQDHLIVLTTS